ncbi:DUF6114 domain-containing protein [Actinoplanes sp. NEAU-A12]|uniref:DUF6114 domain-containing protein n=1 Tax=Actinoplanes sandaracinus TaxID=3045177 RepID=A0ABT6X1L0_9ACTN|nr:DUF6114 domain-containing protein [Actinoplanes sandaracinus]MDI6105858.1 DUF6114 domain-containing protein [Actinoplanes sandaracinus]
MATENIWGRFRRWRRVRPFWGGLLLVLSGLEMLGSANMELDNIKIHIGPQGFFSYLLPVMLITAGVLTWFSPAQRLFYGVIAILTALYSFIGLNLGGWIAGMMLGIVGGALVIAWGPPANPRAPGAGEPSSEPTDQFAGDPAGEEPTRFLGERTAPLAGERQAPLAGERPAPLAGERPTQEIGPVGEKPATPLPRPGSLHRKALIIMAPVLVAATVTAAGHRPAEAAECPEGLPSRKASVSPSASTAKPGPSATRTGSSGSPSSTSPSSSPSPSPSATQTEQESDHPILDGINDFWEGVGDLIGIGGQKQAPASPSAAPSVAPSATATTPSAKPSTSTSPSAPVSAPVSPSAPATAKPEEIPCLGARQMNVRAQDGGLPLAGAKPGVVRVASLTMYESSYDGVAEVPTGNGPIRSLKFTMDKVVNKPFSLTIDEPGDATTVIESGELILDGNVEFYSPTFKGKLFGLIPVTFTPEQPPPLTLPVLWFTDVTLDLAYVRSDVLTAKPLDITEQRA